MYDVSSGKSYPAGYVSLSGQDTFTVSLHSCSHQYVAVAPEGTLKLQDWTLQDWIVADWTLTDWTL